MSGNGTIRAMGISLFVLIVAIAALGYGQSSDPPADAPAIEAVAVPVVDDQTSNSGAGSGAPTIDSRAGSVRPPANSAEFGPSAEPDERAPQPAPPEGPSDPTVLRIVYFVEADQEFDPAAVESIERQMVALQRFWYDQFGGTFRLPVGGVEIVYGDHPARWYDTAPAGDDERWYRLMNIREEVNTKQGLSPGSDNVRTLTFPAARIDGRVGANRYEGAWMDGDDVSCIDRIVETTPYTPDFPASCLGTVAHELGHVYGLGHEGRDEDCMQYGFYNYVSGTALCDFSPENRRIVTSDPRNAGWLDAEPGDRI